MAAQMQQLRGDEEPVAEVPDGSLGTDTGMKTPNVEFSGADKPRLSDSAGTQGYASGDKK